MPRMTYWDCLPHKWSCLALPWTIWKARIPHQVLLSTRKRVTTSVSVIKKISQYQYCYNTDAHSLAMTFKRLHRNLQRNANSIVKLYSRSLSDHCTWLVIAEESITATFRKTSGKKCPQTKRTLSSSVWGAWCCCNISNIHKFIKL